MSNACQGSGGVRRTSRVKVNAAEAGCFGECDDVAFVKVAHWIRVGGLDGFIDHLSTQILSNSELKQKLLGELVPLIYNELKSAG